MPATPALLPIRSRTSNLTRGRAAAALAALLFSMQGLGAQALGPCPFCDLHGAKLAKQDLRDLNLHGANLSGVNLFSEVAKAMHGRRWTVRFVSV